MFVALLEIEELPAMRELSEQIQIIHALISSSVGNPIEYEQSKAILKVLMDKRMSMRKFYFNAYLEHKCISHLKGLSYE